MSVLGCQLVDRTFLGVCKGIFLYIYSFWPVDESQEFSFRAQKRQEDVVEAEASSKNKGHFPVLCTWSDHKQRNKVKPQEKLCEGHKRREGRKIRLSYNSG